MESSMLSPRSAVVQALIGHEGRILNVLPSLLLLLLFPATLFYYAFGPEPSRPGLHSRARLTAAHVLVSVEVFSLAMTLAVPTFDSAETAPAACLNLLAAITTMGMALIEHQHFIPTTMIFRLFLATGILIDTTKTTCNSHRGFFYLSISTASAGVLRCALFILDVASKRGISFTDDPDDPDEVMHYEQDSNVQKEDSSSFNLLNPFFFTSLKTDFAMSDLEHIGIRLSSKLHYSKLTRRLQTYGLSQTDSLATICFRTWNGSFIICLLLRSIVTSFSLAQPFALHRILVYAAQQGEKNKRDVYLLIATSAVLYTGGAVSKAVAGYVRNKLVIRVRGGLTTLLFDKHQKLTKLTAKTSLASALLRNDIDNIARGIPRTIEIVFISLETCASIYLLAYFIGISSLAVVIPLAFSAIATYSFGDQIASSLQTWTENIETRVAKTSKILAQLPGIKMIGLGPVVTKVIHQLHITELKYFETLRTIESKAALAVAISSLTTPAVLTATSVSLGTLNGSISAAFVFSTLNLMTLHLNPLAALLQDYPMFMAMTTSFHRIQSFLHLEERVERRRILQRSQRSTQFTRSVVFTRTRHGPPITEFRTYTSTFAIQFYGVAIVPHGAQYALYTDIDFVIEEGTFTALIGGRDAGKSLLLDAILGEAPIADGVISLGTDVIGFSGHFTWLLNTSVRDNIIGPLEYDAARFRRVIHCCLLQEDLKKLPGGDGFVVGLGGNKLSVGQRQKVSLARTVYADISLLLLDDPLSSLDRRSASTIMFRLLGKDGFLRQSDCTVIFATHLTECIDMADQHLSLDPVNGTVQLHRNDGYQRPSITAPSRNTNASEAVEAQPQDFAHNAVNERDISELKDFTEAHSRKPGRWEVFSSFLSPLSRRDFGVWVFLVLGMSAGEILPGLQLRNSIDDVQNRSWYLLSYATMAISGCVLAPLAQWFIYVRISPISSSHLHRRLLQSAMRSTVGYYGATGTAVFINKFNQSMYQITKIFPDSLFQVLHASFALFLQSHIVFSNLKQLFVTVILLLLFVVRPYVRVSRRIRNINSEDRTALQNLFQDTTDGLVYLRAFGWQGYHMRYGVNLIDEAQKSFWYALSIENWLESISCLCSGALTVALTAMCLFNDEPRSIGVIGLSLYQASGLCKTIYKLSQGLLLYDESWAALFSLVRFTENMPQELASSTAEVPENWPTEGEIVLTNVSARYAPNMPWIINNVSLTAAAGEKVCFFGRPGSGKTSILMAILGFLDYEGTIEIDGIDIASVPRELLRSRIISISQDQVQLDGTIRSNLLPYEDATLDELSEQERADLAEEANNFILGFLSDMGILTEVNAKGGIDAKLQDTEFSKGVLQVLCFARTVMRYHRSHGKLVLLDEATSSMELEQDTAVQRAMWEFFEGCTILQIAHLKESTEDAEISVEIADGSIAHMRRRRGPPPGVESRSRTMLSPESMFGSADSERSTPVRQMSPGERDASPLDTMSLDSRLTQADRHVIHLAGQPLPTGEVIMSLRDRLASPARALSPMHGMTRRGTYVVPSSSGSSDSDSDTGSVAVAASSVARSSVYDGESSASNIGSRYESESRSSYRAGTTRSGAHFR